MCMFLYVNKTSVVVKNCRMLKAYANSRNEKSHISLQMENYGSGLDNKYLAPRLGNVEFNGSFTWV